MDGKYGRSIGPSSGRARGVRAAPGLRRALANAALIALIGCGADLEGFPSAEREPREDRRNDAGDETRDASADRPERDADADAAVPRDAGERDAQREEPVESFAALYEEIFVPKCLECHIATNRSGLNMTSIGIMYTRLIDVPAGDKERDPYSKCKEEGKAGLKRVVPGDPDASLLVQKIDPPGGTAPCGERMPLNRSPLSADEIARVRRWIAQGAPGPAED